MGGRGAFSRTHGVITSSSDGTVTKMSDRQLDRQLKSVNARMEKVSDVMLKTAYGHTGYLQGAPFGNKADYEAYVKASKEYGLLREQMGAISSEQARRIHENAMAKPLKPKTFVNSFGEATTRYITSASYERAQKRAYKDVLRNMGY